MKHFIEKIKNKEDLSFEESKVAFKLLMEGKVNEQDIFEFLTFLSAKGEASDEIAGGVYIIHVDVPGIGQKVLKWFGVMRPIDLDTF